MNKFLTAIYRNRVTKWITIPALLVLLWGLLSFVYLISLDFSPTTVSFNHQSKRDNDQSYVELRGNSVLRGYFKAKENFLGIISIEFKKEDSPIRDQILFRIKELGSSEWLAENTYDTRQFYYIKKFPLGFPIIEDSKGKTYEFEMVSKFGTSEEGVTVDVLNPIVVSKYKYDLSYLTSNPQRMIGFIFNKLSYALSFSENIKYFFIYSLPFIFYYLVLILARFKKNNRVRIKKFIGFPLVKFHLDGLSVWGNFLGYLLSFLLIVNISAIVGVYDLFSFLIVEIWLLAVLLNKHKSKDTFFIALICVYSLILFLSLGLDNMTDKAVLWIYYFLILGSIHGLIELRKEKT